MNIEVIVSNPPYQEMTGGGQAGAKAIWHKFIERAVQINSHYISMITPSRWFTGGLGLNDFRIDWMNDSRISRLVHFQNAINIFENTSIAGGISYFIWDKFKKDHSIEYTNKDLKQNSIRLLNKFDVFIPNDIEEDIVEKVMNTIFMTCDTLKTFEDIVGSVAEYGLLSDYRSDKGSIKVLTSEGIQYCEPEQITKIPDNYRVVTNSIRYEHAGEALKDNTWRIISKTWIIDPDTVTCGHYITVGGYDRIEEARNCEKYLKTKFLRLLVKTRAVGIHIPRQSYKFVPLQDFTDNSDINWNTDIHNIDKQLYKKYGLNQEDIEYIEKTIAVMP